MEKIVISEIGISGVIASLFVLCSFATSAFISFLYVRSRKEKILLQEQNLQLCTEKARIEERLNAALSQHTTIKEQFESLSHQVLTSSQNQFLGLAEASFSKYHTLVSGREEGISKTLEQLSTRTRELEIARERAFSGLSQQLQSLSQAQQLLQKETSHLVSALKSSQSRGRWGELQLKRAVELTGMVSYCDFDEQVYKENDGSIQRPDMVIRLPNKRILVLDAKAPFQSFLESCDAASDEKKKEHLHLHAKTVKGHIERLASKKYWEQFQEAPDFVVLFLPGESFFSSALEQDPYLLEYGVERNVLLATPSTLLALLRIIAYGWTQAEQHQNALKILNEACELCSRLNVFADHFKEMRKGLEKAVKSYNQAASSFETRLLVSARRLEEMKVGVNNQIESPKTIDGFASQASSTD